MELWGNGERAVWTSTRTRGVNVWIAFTALVLGSAAFSAEAAGQINSGSSGPLLTVEGGVTLTAGDNVDELDPGHAGSIPGGYVSSSGAHFLVGLELSKTNSNSRGFSTRGIFIEPGYWIRRHRGNQSFRASARLGRLSRSVDDLSANGWSIGFRLEAVSSFAGAAAFFGAAYFDHIRTAEQRRLTVITPGTVNSIVGVRVGFMFVPDYTQP